MKTAVMAGLVPAIHVFVAKERRTSVCGARSADLIRGLRVRFANACFKNSVLRRPGGHGEEPIPDPIPNSAVKVLCADGTESQDLEE